VDAATVVFAAALITAIAGALAGVGGYLLVRHQEAAERAMRERLEHLVKQVSGGDSYVYLEPLRRDGEIRYFIRQEGQFPTYDVVVRVLDGSGRTLLFGPTSMGMVKRGSGFDWTIPVPAALVKNKWPLLFPEPPGPGATAREFKVELAARNGIVIQQLRASPEGARWHTSSRQIERAGDGPLTLPADFREAQDQP
jgi:hypothetical protein